MPISHFNLSKHTNIIEKNAYEISNEDINNEDIDLIYMDPPFRDKNINNLLERINELKIAKKNTLILLHRNKKFKEKFIKNFEILREEKYGLSKIIFGKLLF